WEVSASSLRVPPKVFCRFVGSLRTRPYCRLNGTCLPKVDGKVSANSAVLQTEWDSSAKGGRGRMNGFWALWKGRQWRSAIQSSGKNTATPDSESMNFKEFLF